MINKTTISPSEGTPLYDEMCRRVDYLHRHLERDGEAIADPRERLRYYQTIAYGMGGDRFGNVGAFEMLVKIRLRAERRLRKLLREG